MRKNVWEEIARRQIKIEMKRAGLDYMGLSERLKDVGVSIDHRVLTNRVNRGTFPHSFYLQCMVAMEAEMDIPRDLRASVGELCSTLRR